jgi:hypothetical protein
MDGLKRPYDGGYGAPPAAYQRGPEDGCIADAKAAILEAARQAAKRVNEAAATGQLSQYHSAGMRVGLGGITVPPGQSFPGQPPTGPHCHTMHCPQRVMGKLIGPRGSTIQDLQRNTGCNVVVSRASSFFFNLVFTHFVITFDTSFSLYECVIFRVIKLPKMLVIVFLLFQRLPRKRWRFVEMKNTLKTSEEDCARSSSITGTLSFTYTLFITSNPFPLVSSVVSELPFGHREDH